MATDVVANQVAQYLIEMFGANVTTATSLFDHLTTLGVSYHSFSNRVQWGPSGINAARLLFDLCFECGNRVR